MIEKKLLDGGLEFAHDIFSKMQSGFLVPGEHTIDDWLANLSAKKLSQFIDLREDGASETEVADLVLTSFYVHFLETGEPTEGDEEEVSKLTGMVVLMAILEEFDRAGVIRKADKLSILNPPDINQTALGRIINEERKRLEELL